MFAKKAPTHQELQEWWKNLPKETQAEFKNEPKSMAYVKWSGKNASVGIGGIANSIFWVIFLLLTSILTISGVIDDLMDEGHHFFSIIIFMIILSLAGGFFVRMFFLVSPAGSSILVIGTMLAIVWASIFGAGLFGGLLLVVSWIVGGILLDFDFKHTNVRIIRGMWRAPSKFEKAQKESFTEQLKK